MGFLSKARQVTANPATSELSGQESKATPAADRPTVEAGPEDTERALEVLLMFEWAVIQGGDSAFRAAARRIAVEGGIPESDMARMRGLTDDPTLLHRPWNWLADVAERAVRRQEPGTVAHVALFYWYWNEVVEALHKPTLADRFDFFLEPAPPSARLRVYSAALRVLPSTDPSTQVVEDAQGGVTFGDLLAQCAKLALRHKDLDQAIRHIAEQHHS